MGANEKHAAAMHGRLGTPSMDIMRLFYKIGRRSRLPDVSIDSMNAEFDRFITKIRAEAKAEALEELAAKTHSKFQAAWIRGQAREYTQGPRKIVGAFATPETNKENKK